jgi:rubrerythrin
MPSDTKKVNLQEMDPLTALRIAISREKGAREFYLRVSEKVAETSVKNRLAYLADVEKDHFDQLSDFYKELTGDSPEIDMNYAEIKGATVSGDITAEKALDLAMEAEQKAYDFYHQAAIKAKSDNAKKMFDYLAGEELEHKRLLSIDKASLPGGHGHFQWATHWDTPPGMEDLW